MAEEADLDATGNNPNGGQLPEEKVSQVSNSTDTAKKREIRQFPRNTLESALKVVSAIREQNAGNPFAPAMIAKAVGIGQKSSNFQYLVAAAGDYGLVSGGYRSQEIALTELGKKVAFPDSNQSKSEAIVEAFRSVAIFASVFDHYKGSNLPDKEFFHNTMRTKFNIHDAHLDEFYDLFRQNCSFCEIDTGRAPNANPPKTSNARSIRTTPHTKGSNAAASAGMPTAFVAIPFVEKNDARPLGFFKEVLEQLVFPALHDAGFHAITANREGSDIIHATIIRNINEADLVVVDITDHNPNVMFELGLRMGQSSKPVAIFKSNDTGRIFDVDNVLRVCEYNPNLWKSTLERDIERLSLHFKATWDQRDEDPTYMQILSRQPD